MHFRWRERCVAVVHCRPLQQQCDDGCHQSINPSIGTSALLIETSSHLRTSKSLLSQALSTLQYVGHQEFYPRRKDCLAIDPYGICFNCDSSCCSCRLFQRSISARIGMVNSFPYSLKIDFFSFLIDVCLVILQSGKVWATLAASVAVAAATASVAFCEEGAGEVKGKVVVKDKNMANLKDANSTCTVRLHSSSFRFRPLCSLCNTTM